MSRHPTHSALSAINFVYIIYIMTGVSGSMAVPKVCVSICPRTGDVSCVGYSERNSQLFSGLILIACRSWLQFVHYIEYQQYEGQYA